VPVPWPRGPEFVLCQLIIFSRLIVLTPGVPKIFLRLAKHAPTVGKRVRFTMELPLKTIAAR
jgi:hypothetical protein